MRAPSDLLPRVAGDLVLRRFSAVDLGPFLIYRDDPVVGRFQGWLPMSKTEALTFIGAMAAAELFQPGAWAQIAVARASDNLLVGDIGLLVRADGRSAEVGFTLTPSAQGKGYATLAVTEAIRLLFQNTAVSEVVGVTDARNARSVRVLRRVGMRKVESRETVFKGEPCTEWVFARQRGT